MRCWQFLLSLQSSFVVVHLSFFDGPMRSYPDGTKERTYPDGSVRVLRVDGSTRSTYPDGSYRVKGTCCLAFLPPPVSITM